MKNKGMQLGAVLAAMLILSMAFVPAVSAKTDTVPSNLSDPAIVKALVDKLSKDENNVSKSFTKLSSQEQAAVIEFFKVKQIIVTKEENVSISSTCNTPRVVVSGKNAFGVTHWSYFQQIDRCYDGSIITSKERTRWGEVYSYLWQFAGHTGNTESGGEGQSSYRAWTQGEFKLCIGGDIGCVQYAYPWIDMIVYGNGNFWYNTGGGTRTYP